MKKLYLALFLFPLYASGTVYTSIANGDWATPTTWSPSGIPGSSDNVIINNTITVSTVQANCFDLTINSGGILNNTKVVGLFDLCTNNIGGKWMGSGDVGIVGPSNGIVLKGGGDFSAQTGTWYFQGPSSAGTTTAIIDASVTLVKNGGGIVLLTSVWHHPVRIVNFGNVTVKGSILSSGGKPTSWTQETNSALSVYNPLLTNTYDTLVASAVGNYVNYDGPNSYSIKTPFSSQYYFLYVHIGTKSVPNNLLVNTFELLSPSAKVNMGGVNMTVTGAWLNYGSVLNNTGTITFNGPSLQTIGGTFSTTFTNLTISGSGNVNLATNSTFTGVLTLSGNGNLTNSAGITMTQVSTSLATARVAQITGSGTISSNFIIQRYDGRSSAQYQSLSSPVQSTTLGDWNTSNRIPIFYMSGVGGPDGTAGSYVSVYLYGETTNTYNPITNFSSPGINYVLKQGQGIYLWMGQNLTSATPFSYITHGVPSCGNINTNVTFTPGEGGGFNIIGNPYPSPMDWAGFAASNPSLSTSYYIFEQDGSWHTFGLGSVIPMEQGFGIVTSSSTALSFMESHKSATDGSLQRAGDPSRENNSATFTLSDDANSYSCPTILSFSNDYSNKYSPSEDAIFIKSFIKEVPQLFTYSGDNHSLALNRLPDLANEIDIPISAVGNVSGNYTLSCSNISNISSYNCVCLIDNESGAILNNFEDNPSYSFNITEAGTAKNFTLKFVRLANGATCNSLLSVTNLNNAPENLNIYANQVGAVVDFHLAKAENALISVYSILGQKLSEIQTNAYNTMLSIPLPASNQFYVIRVETPGNVTVKKLYY